MDGKVAIEEHFVTSALEDLISGVGWSEGDWRRVLARLRDTDRRLQEMDRLGIEIAVLSLGSFGIQDVVEPERAIARAIEANDALAEVVRAHPGRLAGFAALPMQDPDAAADELERAVTRLRFRGRWSTATRASATSTPRSTTTTSATCRSGSASRRSTCRSTCIRATRCPGSGASTRAQRAARPTWAFAVETGGHALRLITSGLFDRCPRLQVIVGHLGEFLPFALPRLEQRISHIPHVRLERPPTQYLRENFHVTTSSDYHTASLIGVLLELGADRLLFAADYPFEEMEDRPLVRRRPDRRGRSPEDRPHQRRAPAKALGRKRSGAAKQRRRGTAANQGRLRPAHVRAPPTNASGSIPPIGQSLPIDDVIRADEVDELFEHVRDVHARVVVEARKVVARRAV